MKLLFVADLHYALKQFDWIAANVDGYDLVIIGGDLLDLGSALDFDVQIAVVEKYLDRLRARTKVLVSSGNHDGDARNAADESYAQWLLEARADGLYVDGDSPSFSGTLITICPWWDGPVSRAEVEALLERDQDKPKNRWIWVHHSPPDASPTSWTGKKFAGDTNLVEWIKRFSPDVVLCGHIHNAPFYSQGCWVDRVGRTWVFNPGRQIGPSPTMISLDLDAFTAEWDSMEGQSVARLDVDPG